VPDEPGRTDTGGVENLGKAGESFLVHVRERPGKGDRVGPAVPGPAVDEGAASGFAGEFRWKVAPGRGASDPIVKEDEGGGVFRPGAVPDDLDAAASRGNRSVAGVHNVDL
jgi:hypothetical protein